MQVIGHDGEGVNTSGTANRGSPEVFQEPIAVDVIASDILTAVAAGHKVVDCVSVLERNRRGMPFTTKVSPLGCKNKLATGPDRQDGLALCGQWMPGRERNGWCHRLRESIKVKDLFNTLRFHNAVFAQTTHLEETARVRVGTL
jgi:hypothetical protein